MILRECHPGVSLKLILLPWSQNDSLESCVEAEYPKRSTKLSLRVRTPPHGDEILFRSVSLPAKTKYTASLCECRGPLAPAKRSNVGP